MNVLICSQHGENQVEEVCKRLQKMGATPILFERYRKDQFISYRYGKKVNAVLKTEEGEFELDSKTFPAVWYRPKPIILGEIPGEAAKIKERFCIHEWKTLLQSLDIFLTESKWINPLLHNQRSSNKAFQLKLAKELGFQIPETVITNDSSVALELFANDRVIYKTLGSFFSSTQAIYTNEISYDHVKERQQEIAMAPGIFQNYISKQYELRITVVGERVFSVKIDSQAKLESSIDWRRSPDRKLYEVGEISKLMHERLLLLHKQLGLVYAAYDFIVDDKGNEIFLECNPSGQWLWLEESLGIDISQAMANELVSV